MDLSLDLDEPAPWGFLPQSVIKPDVLEKYREAGMRGVLVSFIPILIGCGIFDHMFLCDLLPYMLGGLLVGKR